MGSTTENTEEQEVNFYFIEAPSEETRMAFGPGTSAKIEKKADINAHLLTRIMKGMTTELENAGIHNYEMTLKGTIEVSAGIPTFLGGKAGFEAELKITSDKSKTAVH